ncbi:MAG TPA: 16S rRNA (cytosine(1402)-N(4))-methyltransferase RsmH [Candidatus Limnocylindria bacterium]|nr:16S rRNA (cytosine(1402)-N(4))-methyltransferase RsmH [Candidatus Limnocylindria bacterium]
MFSHVSVLVREVIEFLKPAPGRRYLDGTLGGGGHAEQILIDSSPDGELLGLDRDEEALAAARQRLLSFEDRLVTRQASFAAAREVLADIHWNAVDGVILDLGISSHQIDAPERGFSFRARAPLDMRMDRRQALDARHIVNSFAPAELEKIFRAYGEELQARRIAQAIVAERKARPIETTADLAGLIEGVKGRRRRDHHPATQVFQALRIAVNEEIRQLESFLESGYDLLRPGARMAIVAFHSLEDRLVKNAFRKWSRACICPPRALRCQCGWSQKTRLLTKKPVVPSENEVRANPRARSAKLRAVERI